MAAAAAAAAAAPRKQIHIDVIQSVMPVAVTPPGRSQRLSTTGGPLRPELLQSRVRIVLYYDDKGSATPATVGAWIKESLSAALATEPVMAGRLRRENDGSGRWEVKFNDCGARLVQATAEASMAEFMSGDGDRWEAHLAHWVDVDEENPNFSALFYVQVTQFHGGGFSIGISCSLLLADPFFLGHFLQSWARTHAAMLSHGQLTDSSIFHLAYFQRPGQSNHLKSIDLGLSSNSNPSAANTTLLFAANPETDNVCQIADNYFQVATRRLRKKDLSNYSLIVSDHSGDKIVETHTIMSPNVIDETVSGAQEEGWVKQLGLEKMCFVGGNDPIRISCQIISCVDDGLVMIIMPPKKAWLISVTVPTI
ncbi:uncharacterized protein LOC121998034 [Zingiber officinale]|uniref:uncharacterized protein LOC121998034 n=1 Tax=Zingiber officinale TaxID=94328 RepID=UPI001C4C6998|nr:uncharacterized protein LOC121998034 [Zingiber officinale]